MARVVFAVPDEVKSSSLRNKVVVVVEELNSLLVARYVQVSIGGPYCVVDIMSTVCGHDRTEPEGGLWKCLRSQTGSLDTLASFFIFFQFYLSCRF